MTSCGTSVSRMRSCARASAPCTESPFDVILDLRVKTAMTLLARTQAPIGVIARKVGFSSAAYFVRAFRKRVKTTPAAYRRTARLGQSDTRAVTRAARN